LKLHLFKLSQNLPKAHSGSQGQQNGESQAQWLHSATACKIHLMVTLIFVWLPSWGGLQSTSHRANHS